MLSRKYYTLLGSQHMMGGALFMSNKPYTDILKIRDAVTRARASGTDISESSFTGPFTPGNSPAGSLEKPI